MDHEDAASVSNRRTLLDELVPQAMATMRCKEDKPEEQEKEGNEVMATDNIKSPSGRKTLAPAKNPKGGKEKPKASYPPRMAMNFVLDRETLEALNEVEAQTGERRWDIVPRLIRLERVRLTKEKTRKKVTTEE